MSADARSPSNWTAAPDDWEPWMELIDRETLDWIPDAPASAAQAG